MHFVGRPRTQRNNRKPATTITSATKQTIVDNSTIPTHSVDGSPKSLACAAVHQANIISLGASHDPINTQEPSATQWSDCHETDQLQLNLSECSSESDIPELPGEEGKLNLNIQ
jgi:hypothetical protein